jgi:Fe-S-cluster formation regulator IscX/YfhJ
MFNRKLIEKYHSEMVLAFTELEKRIIALEKFNEEEGKELLEALQENKKQEKLFTEGMQSILNYSLESTRKKAE